MSKPIGSRSNVIREKCTRCGLPVALASSAIDGRPAYTCPKCGHYWTNGRKPGQGYKRWRRR